MERFEVRKEGEARHQVELIENETAVDLKIDGIIVARIGEKRFDIWVDDLKRFGLEFIKL